MIQTYEEERYAIRKDAIRLKRQFKDIKVEVFFEKEYINREIKKSLYQVCYLKHLIKKHKTDKIFYTNTDYTDWVRNVRFEYKKTAIYTKVTVKATLLSSHRLYINREMGTYFHYNEPFYSSIVMSSSLKELFHNIVNTLRSYKKFDIQSKKRWLETSSKSKLSIQRYDEAMEALSEGGSFSPKRDDTSKYVGVEIECLSKINFDEMRDVIATEAPSLSKYLKLGEDGSIRTEEGYNNAIEFRFLMKDSEKEKVLNLFQKAVGPYIKVNDSCGLHVHLDMRSRPYARSFERLVDVTPILMSMVPKSRRENSYCLVNKNKKEHALTGRASVGRYRVINPQSYGKYKTLEVRVHSATKNASKIINWINLLTLIVDKEFTFNTESKKGLKEPKRRITNLISFFTRYEVPANLRNYITMRIAKFGRFKELLIPKELEALLPSQTTEVTTSQDEAS